MENLNQAVRKEGAIRGVLFGILMLVVDILKLYYLAHASTSPILTFVVLYPVYYIILFGAALLFISGLRNKIGRYWNLKQAITGIFIMLIFTTLIWNNGIALFSGKINPELAEKAHVSFVASRKAAMQSSHTPAKRIEQEVVSMNQTFAAGSKVTVQSFFRSLFVSVILVFAVSAVLGVLFKRERPAQPQA
ncbi:DUF4199 domain-containing protein [Mucilaginibacter sp. PAMB04168]|uniref:DUF4199 domain-containing protein n=1 Tax=Mucilaginibacter sp. PAMB04168 TaxID=3138567 RepID=UPI0031F651D8